MKHEAEGVGGRPTAVRYPYGGHEMGAIAIGNQILVAPDHRWVIVIWCLCSGSRCLGARRRYCSQRQTASQRGAALEEFPSIKSFRTHRPLLRKWESLPAVESIQPSRGAREPRPHRQRHRLETRRLFVVL